MKVKSVKLEQSINVPIGKLKKYSSNIKVHSKTQIRVIANSIKTYGFDQPIVVDRDFVIIKGHGRYEAAILLGLTEVPVIIKDLIDEEVAASRIVDNKSSESEIDSNLLRLELATLNNVGVLPKDLGFSSFALGRIFKDDSNFTKKVDKGVKSKSSGDEVEDTQIDTQDKTKIDVTIAERETFVAFHKGSSAWLRKLSMQDYLNYHTYILIGMSGGKDSVASALWCKDNCDPTKLCMYYTNPGWMVDWAQSFLYTYWLAFKLEIPLLVSGSWNTKLADKWEETLMQKGFPKSAGCWIETNIKTPQIADKLREAGYITTEVQKIVQVVSVRHVKLEKRASAYPDRGFYKDTKNNYASPIIEWTDADVVAYLSEKNIPLHPAYSVNATNSCICCPKLSTSEIIAIRKRYPHAYKTLMQWYTTASRGGGLFLKSFNKCVCSLVDNKWENVTPFSGTVMTTEQLEQEVGDMLSMNLAGFCNRQFDEYVITVEQVMLKSLKTKFGKV